VALARDPDIEEMMAYKPRYGPWHTVDPNPSLAGEDLLLWLDNDDHEIMVINQKGDSSMMFKMISELNEVLKRNPMDDYAELQLDNYLVVVAENDEADDCLSSLEDNECFPLTVAWYSQEGRKVRIYQRAKEIQTGGVSIFGLDMTILTGVDTMCPVASPLARLRDYDDSWDESFIQEEPAALNRQALNVFQSLIYLTDCPAFNDGGNNLQAI
jgi:hypothetical protein